MNWKELRPILRQNFGKDFHFYNDQYKSGTRRIKICTSNINEMFNFIKKVSPNLDTKIYEQKDWYGIKQRITIHYK